MKWLFSITIFLGAALLFLVQPMVAKLMLPVFGGSSLVWNTCMVFFQGTLLIGYAYAHLIAGRTSGPPRAGTWNAARLLIHALVLGAPVLSLPLVLPAGFVPATGVQPVWPLLGALAGMALLPAAVMATTGPLVQAWYSRTSASDAHDPYFLYSASNAGSLVGLLGYPFAVERLIPLSQQGRAWAGAYAVYAVLALVCGGIAVVRSHTEPDASCGTPAGRSSVVKQGSGPGWRDRVWWVALAFGPSSLTLGATQYISTDVGSFPLLWTLPLTAYIASFMVSFSVRGRVVARLSCLALPPLAVLVAGAVMVATTVAAVSNALLLILGLHVGLVLLGSIAAHSRLYEKRPPATHLTEFYLLIAVGGVLGGAFNALLSPLVFSAVWEYPIAIAMVLALGARGLTVPGVRFLRASDGTSWWRTGLDAALPVLLFLLCGLCFAIGRVYQLPTDFERPMLEVGVPILACLFFVNRPLRLGLGVLALFVAAERSHWAFVDVLHRSRTYYGVHVVNREASLMLRTLSHGTTKHTVQSERPALEMVPQAYYHPSGPIGQVFAALHRHPGSLNVGLVGMGGGALAAYSRAGDRFAFYEIDPEVRRIATDPRLFTYVPKARGTIDVVMGDARLSLRGARDGEFDMIVLDAFSADAVPTHLLTREAFDLYRIKLKPGGIIAIHISNRFFTLTTPLGALARDTGLHTMFWRDAAVSPDQAAGGKILSVWMAVSERYESLEPCFQPGQWSEVHAARSDSEAWTDDFTNPLSALHSWW